MVLRWLILPGENLPGQNLYGENQCTTSMHIRSAAQIDRTWQTLLYSAGEDIA